jgi:hypothetical protein
MVKTVEAREASDVNASSEREGQTRVIGWVLARVSARSKAEAWSVTARAWKLLCHS